MSQNKKILIGNGPVITRDLEHPFFENGAVIVQGEWILEVGEYQELLNKYPDAEQIDANGKLIMPGYINAHHHIYSAFARGLTIHGNHPSNFLEILEGTWWNIDRHLSLEQTYYSAIATYLECIKNGVTTLVDHHASYKEIKGSLKQIARAAEELGIRTCLAYEISDRDGQDKMKEAVDETFAWIQDTMNPNNSMQKALVGMHASFTLSDETIAYCKEKNKQDIGYHIHVAEGEYDEIHAHEHFGCSVVERLNRLGILGEKTLAGHCIHISESDMDILKETGTTVIHNPESNMGNAVGAPDILKMMGNNILVGLGTDGYTTDMMESVKVANILQKHQSKDPDRGFGEAVTMLFQNNAEIATKLFSVPLGVLKKGAAADLIVVDYQPYTPMNQENYNGHLLFGVSGSMTDTTIINGKIRMKNREIVIENMEELYAKCKESSKELWRTLNE